MYGADLTCGHPAQLYSEAREAIDRFSLLEPEAAPEGRGAGGAGGARESEGGRRRKQSTCVPRGGREGEGRRCGQERQFRGVLGWWLRATHLLSKVWQGMEAAAGGRAGSGEERAWW